MGFNSGFKGLIWFGTGTRTGQVESVNDLLGLQKIHGQLNKELLATDEKYLQHSLVVTFNNVYISSCKFNWYLFDPITVSSALWKFIL